MVECEGVVIFGNGSVVEVNNQSSCASDPVAQGLLESQEQLEPISSLTSKSQCPAPFAFRWATQHNDGPSQRTFHRTDWDALLQTTKGLSGDPTCASNGNFHAGGRHIVRLIRLAGRSELWLARIPTVPDSLVAVADGGWWTKEDQFTMESEIATMKFITQTTDILVPRVYGYSTTVEGSAAKVPYLLMECIEGNMIFDLGGPGILTDEQRAKLRKSIASIQCKLANATLPKLGSLVLNSDGDVDIGPLPAQLGFEGPFDSPLDYVLSWAAHNTSFKNSHLLRDPNLLRATESFPRRLAMAAERLITAERASDDYPILHPDFLLHNVLLNNDYDIVGVIDWEYAHTSPIDIFAARTNMYASLDPRSVDLAMNEDGKEYLLEVSYVEEVLHMSKRLSQAFGSPLGDLGLCMQLFEEGRALPFDIVIDRAEKG